MRAYPKDKVILGLCSLDQDTVELEVCTPKPLAAGYLQKGVLLGSKSMGK